MKKICVQCAEEDRLEKRVEELKAEGYRTVGNYFIKPVTIPILYMVPSSNYEKKSYRWHCVAMAKPESFLDKVKLFFIY
jgi:hypothetical protein